MIRFLSSASLFAGALFAFSSSAFAAPGVLRPGVLQAGITSIAIEAGFSVAPFLKSVSAQVAAQPVRASSVRFVRVGLSTQGGAIQILSPRGMTIMDALQTGRRLTVKAGETAIFFAGKNARVPTRGLEYSGPITIRTDGGDFPAWKMPRIWTNGNATRVSTNNNSPRWQRAYRGHFEVALKTFSFEPDAHKGALRLVNIVPLEEYLKGVVPWEMDASAPLEALKAQAICARSETLFKIGNGRHAKDGFEICDYDHCQGYPGTENENARTSLATEQTAGLVMFSGGHIADAVYGTNSGGITAASEDVWRGAPRAYLQRRADFSSQAHPQMSKIVKATMSENDWVKYCTTNISSFAQPSAAQIRSLASRRAKSPAAAALFQAGDLPEFYRWSRSVNPFELAKALASHSKARMSYVSSIQVEERAPSGHIKKLLIVGHEVQNGKIVSTSSVRLEGDSQIRAMLSGRLGSTTALPSSTFVVLPKLDNQKRLQSFVLRGAGWGHGVGMCQRGAQNRALAGWKARQIIAFYYHDVELRELR